MRISYIMMQYPLPTQTFAISDIATLISMGHEVNVECLLPKSQKQAELIDMYGLDAKHIRNPTIIRYLYGCLKVIPMHVRHWAFFAELWKSLGRDPKRILALLVLLPRIIELTCGLAKSRRDVVHAFWGHWPSIVPALLELRGLDVCTSTHMGAYDLYAGFPLHLTSDVVSCRFTHALSNLPRIEQMGVTREVTMIHRGIPLSAFSSFNSDGTRIVKNPEQICTASALTANKNVDHLLRVFAKVTACVDNLNLVIAGDGDQRGYLEQLAVELGIADIVSFVGYVRRDDLFRIMSASQYFIFFSNKKSERLPNVVKEAMFAECACIVSRTQGIDELIPSRDYGIVVDDSDVKSAADEVISLVTADGAAAKMGSIAASFVMNNFSSESAMARYVKTWNAAGPQIAFHHRASGSATTS